MKVLSIAFILCFATAGCYTLIYPPPEEWIDESLSDTTVIAITDSSRDVNITIINENQLIFDRYYQDPYYYRYDRFGGYGYWDPYYYNPHGYYRDNRWRHGRYRSYSSSGKATPKQQKSRRTKDYRQISSEPSENPDEDSPADDRSESNYEPTGKRTVNKTADETKPPPKDNQEHQPEKQENRDDKSQPTQTRSDDADKSDRNQRILREANPENVKKQDNQDKQDKAQNNKDKEKKPRREKELRK